MSLFSGRKLRILSAAFLFSVAFLFCLSIQPVQAYHATSSYSKPLNGTLTSANWNDLFSDFVNTWLPTTLNGPLGIGTTIPPSSGLYVNGPVSALNVYSTSNVGIGKTNPGSALDMIGSINSSGTINGTGLCIANDCKVSWLAVGASSSGWTLSGSDIYKSDTAGNVGVGRTNPDQKLTINGGIGFGANYTSDKKLYSPADGVLEWMTHNSAGEHGFAISHQGTKYIYLNTAGNSYFNNGNIGVGTSNPNSLLHIVKDNYPELKIQNTNITSPSNFSFLAGGGYGDNKSFVIQDNTAGAARIIINNLGNIGIGTSTPTQKLSVAGVIESTTGGFKFPDGTTQITAGGGSGTSQWTTASTNIYYNTGNVGIGVTNPATKLDVRAGSALDGITLSSGSGGSSVFRMVNPGTSNNLQLGTLSSNSIDIITNNSSKVTISDPLGNVGIGTTNPQSTLQVNGGQLLVTKATTPAIRLATDVADATDADRAFFGIATGANNFVNGAVANDTVLRGRSSGNFLFSIGSGSALLTIQNSGNVIVNSGNVGIGTTAPRNKLHTVGLGSYPASLAEIPQYSHLRIQPRSDQGGSLYITGNGDSSTLILQGALDATTTRMISLNPYGGNIGIAKANPTTTLDITGGVNASGTVNGTGLCIGGDCKVSWPAVGAASAGWTLNGTTVYKSDTAGNVGIGTTAPNKKLEIYHSDNNGLLVNRNTSSLWSAVSFGTAGTQNWGIGQEANRTYLYFREESVNTNRMVIATGGNVGIGTTNPGFLLDVGNYAGTTAVSNTLRVTGYKVNADGAFANLRLSNAADSGGSYFGIVARRETGNYGVSADFTVNEQTTGATPLTALTLKYNGNVGIGTTTPGQLLEIAGGTQIKSNGVVYLGYTDGTAPIGGMKLSINGASYTSGNTLINGNVGIGTTTPAQKLQVAGTIRTALSGSGNRCVYVDASGDLYAKSVDCGTASGGDNLGNHIATQNIQLGSYWLSGDGGNEGLAITSLGNVGVMKTNPTNALDIVGGINASGTVNGTGLCIAGDCKVSWPAVGAASSGWTQNGSVVYKTDTAGNVGIGTTNPTAAKLTISGDLSATGATLSGALVMNGGGTNQNISGVNKLTVNTIDPLYYIKGVNYSSYASSVVGGVKEEYIGKIRLDKKNKVVQEFEASLDFSAAEEGSELWLWRKVVDFNKDNVDVLITPYGRLARTYYFIDGERLVFRSDTPVEISYRLVGKRFDWREWPTLASDQTERGMEVK